MNERGHFFSEGNYDILGPPLTDGEDAITWMSTQPWSNGKVGTIGCSSTAEWQMAVAALGQSGVRDDDPAGLRRGRRTRGAVLRAGQLVSRRRGADAVHRVALRASRTRCGRCSRPTRRSEDLIRASKSFDLAQQMPPVDWSKALRHLPVQDIIKAVDGPRGIFADAMPVATGGAMIQRTPNDPAWYRGGLWHDDMKINMPGLLVHVVVRRVGRAEPRGLQLRAQDGASRRSPNQQYAVIAPTLHCSYTRATENTVVGERDMGDARLDYDALTYGWFDHFLKGERQRRARNDAASVRYYTMGLNKWQTSDTWPPAGAQPMTFYPRRAAARRTR